MESTKQTENLTENGNCAKPLLANRLLKFRAWSKNIDEHFMAIQGTPDLETLSNFMFHYSDEPIIMQFTGLKDKNGKEIYESDLILDEEYDDDGNDISSSLEVLFDNETSQYVVDNSYAKTRTSLVSIVNYIGIENLQVIGNIYQNPELLFKPLM